MAPTPDPQPDHPFVGPLDPIFKENAAALAGWMTYLNHPEEHTGPRLLEYSNGTVAEEIDDTLERTGDVTEVRSLLRDLEPFRFFAHADVLSGQRVGELSPDGQFVRGDVIADTFQLIEEVRNKKPASMTSPREHSADVYSDLKHYVDPLFADPNWTGTTRDGAFCRFGQVKKWYENHRDPALTAMSMFLVKYSAIILKARADINELMGKLVAFFKEWTKPMSIADIAEFALSVLRAVLELKPKLIDGLFMAYDVTKDAADLAKKSDKPTGFGYDSSDHSNGIYHMLDSYITAGDDVMREAATAVHNLVTDPDHGVLAVRNNWMGVPDWTVKCEP
ncbi:MAG TPA: hypothetical protein VGD71_40175 [Kribbella sp.]|jgi:hypothetical protein